MSHLSSKEDQLFTADQLGIVLIWSERPGGGRYGYVTPFRPSAGQSVFYFDDLCLKDSNATLAGGDFVRFRIEKHAKGPIQVLNVRPQRSRSEDPCLDFLAQDLKNWLGLLQEYKKAPIPIAKRLARALGIGDRIHYVGKDHSSWHWAENTRASDVIKYLNRVISGPLIFDEERIAQIKLRPQTRTLLNKHPKKNELKLLNRLLIEDAYPYAFHTWYSFTEATNILHASVRETDVLNRVGWLTLPTGAAVFHFDVFPADSLVPQPGARVQCRNARNLEAYDILEIPSTCESASPLPCIDLPSQTTDLIPTKDSTKLQISDESTEKERPDSGKIYGECDISRSPASQKVDSNVFRKSGNMWTLAYRNKEVHLKHSFGLHYIALLIRHQSRWISTKVLAESKGDTIIENVSGPEVVADHESLKQVRSQILKLKSELEEAESANRQHDAKMLEEEIEQHTKYLNSAVGRGGRLRSTNNTAEKVRKRVCAPIERSLIEIRKAHPTLWEHFDKAIQRGADCAYMPGETVKWDL
jgi:hypothetical protein